MIILVILIVQFLLSLCFALPAPMQILENTNKLTELGSTAAVNLKITDENNHRIIYEYYDDKVLFPRICDEFCSYTYPPHTYPKVS